MECDGLYNSERTSVWEWIYPSTFLLSFTGLMFVCVCVFFQRHTTSHQLFPTGPTPPLTSGTTSNTSNQSVPTTTSTRWPGPSLPISPSETPWDMRPTRDMNTERGRKQPGGEERVERELLQPNYRRNEFLTLKGNIMGREGTHNKTCTRDQIRWGKMVPYTNLTFFLFKYNTACVIIADM